MQSSESRNRQTGKMRFSFCILSFFLPSVNRSIKNGVLPSHENNLFQLAAAALVAGTFLLFYSLSAVFMQAASARKCFYLKGLNTFLVRQIGSKIRTNYLVVTVVCGLLTITICAALLALKQLTETTDNVYRYGLLQKLGAGRRQIDHTLFVQTVVFFAIPLVVAGVYSAFLIGKAMAVVEEFMNIHIATNIGLTIVLFLLVYGSYFLATYLSCKRIVTEQRELEV